MKNNRKSRKKLFIRTKSILKRNGVWDKMDTVYLFKDMPSEEFALINWKKPHSKKAMKNSKHIDTNFKPQTKKQ